VSEFKDHSDVDRGVRAERILEDELVKEAFQLVEDHFIGMFRRAPLRDEEGVIKAKQLLHALTLFRRVFEDALRNGRLAEQALSEKRKGVSFLGDIWQSRQPRRP
jgi:hypothetical protein